MKRGLWFGVILVFILVGTAFALRGFLADFNTRYGTSGTALNTCNLCHPDGSSGKQFNAYATAYINAGQDFANIENLDSDGDGFTNIVEINALTFPGDPTSRPAPSDAMLPVVTGFSIPATSTSLTVPITLFTATDNVAVAGYLANESAVKPAANAPGWTAAPPASYLFATEGAKTLYGWAKDAAGNVSNSANGPVAINLPGAAPADINGDDTVELADAILTLQVLSGINPEGILPDYPSSGADVNGDGQIGVEEIIYILQKASSLR